MTTRRRVTLREVASSAGVSLGTASGVFSNNPSVSEEARSAVLAAAAEMGYRPRRRSNSNDGITTIGLLARAELYLVPDNPFYGPVLHGIQQAASELGLSVITEVVRAEELAAGNLPLVIERKHAQGLLFAGYLDSAQLEVILDSGLACVCVDHRPETLDVDCVLGQDEQGGYAATEHLLELGHLDPVPAMIGGPVGIWTVDARLDGYLRALAAAGLKPNPDYIRHGELHPESGRAEMAALLDLPIPPTAVFCCNDSTAIGALEELRERGIAVPGEFSVIGYDDIAMATYSVPPLTTIAVEKELLGIQAVWHLIERLRRPEIGIRETKLRHRMIIRGSTAPRRPRLGGDR